MDGRFPKASISNLGRSRFGKLPVQKNAEHFVAKSLRKAGLSAKLVSGSDDSGLSLTLSVVPDAADSAREWLAGFGRSYGPVRIYIVEAQ